MVNQPSYFTSVIIPVFNDSKRLIICLESLERQTYPKHLYEIIVVDNASEEDIKSVTVKFPQVKFCHESQPGSYAARNRGISVAKGEIIAFTDSDCIPSSDWIEQGVKTILSIPNCGLVVGRINLFFQNPDKPTPVEIFDKIQYLQQEKTLNTQHFGATANVFTFKFIFDNVGLFDSNLKSGGDRQWGERVFASGYKQVYTDEACVDHPARSSFSQLRSKVIRIAGGEFDKLMSQKHSLIDIIVDIIKTCKPPIRNSYRAWKNEELKRFQFQQKLQFIFLMFLVKYTIFIEKIRLYLGGESARI